MRRERSKKGRGGKRVETKWPTTASNGNRFQKLPYSGLTTDQPQPYTMERGGRTGMPACVRANMSGRSIERSIEKNTIQMQLTQ